MTSVRRVAITLDAEGGHDFPGHSDFEHGWASTLDVLEDLGVLATIFLHGEWVLQHRELAVRALDAGHLLGNHTLNHLPLGKFPDLVAPEIEGGAAAIREIVPRAAVQPWLRLPYLSGDHSPRVAKELERLGWEHVRENADGKDWNPAFDSPSAIANNVLADAGDQDVVVTFLHTWPRATPRALEKIIGAFRAEEATFVLIDELTAVERSALPARGPDL